MARRQSTAAGSVLRTKTGKVRIARPGDRRKAKIIEYLEALPEPKRGKGILTGEARTLGELTEELGYAHNVLDTGLHFTTDPIWRRYRFRASARLTIFAHPKTIQAIRDGKFDGIGPQEWDEG